MEPASREKTLGFCAALGTFFVWGLLPLYFSALKHLSPVELLAQRILWTAVTLFIVKLLLGRLSDLRTLFASRDITLTCAISAALIGGNWLIFVYAVSTGQVLQTSLGYFICPLLNVLLGLLFLREHLGAVRIAAVALATSAVCVQVLYYGQVPVIALSLALTFALYGLTRKHLRIDPLTGLFGDVIFLLPPSLLYFYFSGNNTFVSGDNGDRLMLYMLAPITVIPLSLFAWGARRLDLSTLGMCQYLAPTMSFLIAVFWLREPFSNVQAVSFGLIWIALAIYSYDALRANARARRLARQHQPAPEMQLAPAVEA